MTPAIIAPARDCPIDLLEAALRADFERGVLFWRHRPFEHFTTEQGWRYFNGRLAGNEALTSHGGGTGHVSSVSFAGVRYNIQRSRTVWALKYKVWPTLQIGHRNGNVCDDRLENLREQTWTEQNVLRRQRAGKSGVVGVNQVRNGNYEANISNLGRRVHLGTFRTREAAEAARIDAEISIFGKRVHAQEAGERS